MFYVFPVTRLRNVPRTKNWGKLYLDDVPKADTFVEKWSLIRAFLDKAKR